MNINGREISAHKSPYIVAELSANHSGSIDKAFRMIDAAKHAGADAVKLQTYVPGELTKPSNTELWKLYEKAQTPREWHWKLFEHAKANEITIFSSAFSVDGVKFLETLNTPAHKIASAELNDFDLIRAAFETGKPVIISTGLAHSGDLEKFKFKDNVVLLHCISRYPSRIEEANLRCINTLSEINLTGLSDHTSGFTTALAATALGAVMIEKHFKLDDDCIDAAYSLNPKQFRNMCRMVRAVWDGLGDGILRPSCQPRSK